MSIVSIVKKIPSLMSFPSKHQPGNREILLCVYGVFHVLP